MHSKKSRLGLVLGVVAAVLVVAGSAFATLKLFGFFKTGSGDTHGPVNYSGIYYIQDNELWYNPFGQNKPVFIDDDIFDDDESSRMTNYYTGFFVSEDGKYIYYARNMNGDNFRHRFELCCTKADGSGKTVRIGKRVIYFRVLHNNSVVYMDEDLDLYLSDMKDSELIAENVAGYYNFFLDDTQKYILWLDRDRNLYYRPMDLKDKKKKIDKDVENVAIFNDNFRNVVYTKIDEEYFQVYQVTDLKDKQTFVKDIDSYASFLKDDKINMYYTRILDRSMAGEAGPKEQESYYLDGDGKEQLICSGVCEMLGNFEADHDSRAMLYRIKDPESGEFKLNITTGDTTAEIDLEGNVYFNYRVVTPGNDKVLVMAQEPGHEESYNDPFDLYVIDTTLENLGHAELFDTDIDEVFASHNDSIVCGYETDFSKNFYIITYNGETIAEDAYSYSLQQNRNTDVFAYYTDYRWEYGVPRGTFNIYKAGESIEVEEDVYNYHIYNDRYIAVLSDYNKNQGTGDLLLFNGKDCEEIAEDVSQIVFAEDYYIR